MSHKIAHHIEEFLVSPYWCKELMQMNLTRETAYVYRKYPKAETYNVICPLIDPLEIIYNELKNGSDTGNLNVPDYSDLPAYTVMDMLKCIPDYSICNTNGVYDVAVSDMYKVVPTTDSRLPDAAARMVYRLIKNRFIQVNQLNQIITNPIKK